MTLGDLNKIAEALMQYIVESNGIEVYRIYSNVSLKWAPEVEKHWGPKDLVNAGKALQGLVADIYVYAAQELMKKYDWIEGFDRLIESLDIRTDYPVLDVRNRMVPDPEKAEKRLKDLEEIQAFVNQTFRTTKIAMQTPDFYKRLAKAR
jgi:hypothetical protein